MGEKVYGLLGRKLGHSWSAPIHAALGCADYRLIELEPEELGKLFDRFYRDKARCSGGFGIGLSLARSIAEAHRGTLTAQNGPDGTIEFRAELREAKPKKETS